MKPDSVDKVTQMPTVSADEYKDPVNNNVSSPDDNLPVQDKAGIQVTIVGKIDLPNTKKDKKVMNISRTNLMMMVRNLIINIIIKVLMMLRKNMVRIMPLISLP